MKTRTKLPLPPRDARRDHELVCAFICARTGPRTPGSRAAETAFVERIMPVVRRCAAAMAPRHRPMLSAADLVQRVLLDFLSRPAAMGCFDPARGTLDGWVRSLARNSILGSMRTEQRRSARSVPLEDDDGAISAHATGAADPVVRAHAARVLREFAASAHHLELRMFDALFLRGRAPADIARDEGWRCANTPNLWRFRIRKRLASIARELEFAPLRTPRPPALSPPPAACARGRARR